MRRREDEKTRSREVEKAGEAQFLASRRASVFSGADPIEDDEMTGDFGDAGWREHLIEDRKGITAILDRVRRIAVLGIKTKKTGEPAYYVPEYAQRAGYEIVPVPVYFPEVTEILGHRVYRRVADIPEPVDMVNVFRRPHDIPPHADDILAARPSVVWMQSGIAHAEVAERLARAGIDIVQDRCLLVELRIRGR